MPWLLEEPEGNVGSGTKKMSICVDLPANCGNALKVLVMRQCPQ